MRLFLLADKKRDSNEQRSCECTREEGLTKASPGNGRVKGVGMEAGALAVRSHGPKGRGAGCVATLSFPA